MSTPSAKKAKNGDGKEKNPPRSASHLVVALKAGTVGIGSYSSARPKTPLVIVMNPRDDAPFERYVSLSVVCTALLGDRGFPLGKLLVNALTDEKMTSSLEFFIDKNFGDEGQDSHILNEKTVRHLQLFMMAYYRADPRADLINHVFVKLMDNTFHRSWQASGMNDIRIKMTDAAGMLARIESCRQNTDVQEQQKMFEEIKDFCKKTECFTKQFEHLSVSVYHTASIMAAAENWDMSEEVIMKDLGLSEGTTVENVIGSVAYNEFMRRRLKAIKEQGISCSGVSTVVAKKPVDPMSYGFGVKDRIIKEMGWYGALGKPEKDRFPGGAISFQPPQEFRSLAIEWSDSEVLGNKRNTLCEYLVNRFSGRTKAEKLEEALNQVVEQTKVPKVEIEAKYPKFALGVINSILQVVVKNIPFYSDHAGFMDFFKHVLDLSTTCSKEPTHSIDYTFEPSEEGAFDEIRDGLGLVWEEKVTQIANSANVQRGKGMWVFGFFQPETLFPRVKPILLEKMRDLGFMTTEKNMEIVLTDTYYIICCAVGANFAKTRESFDKCFDPPLVPIHFFTAENRKADREIVIIKDKDETDEKEAGEKPKESETGKPEGKKPEGRKPKGRKPKGGKPKGKESGKTDDKKRKRDNSDDEGSDYQPSEEDEENEESGEDDDTGTGEGAESSDAQAKDAEGETAEGDDADQPQTALEIDPDHIIVWMAKVLGSGIAEIQQKTIKDQDQFLSTVINALHAITQMTEVDIKNEKLILKDEKPACIDDAFKFFFREVGKPLSDYSFQNTKIRDAVSDHETNLDFVLDAVVTQVCDTVCQKRYAKPPHYKMDEFLKRSKELMSA